MPSSRTPPSGCARSSRRCATPPARTIVTPPGGGSAAVFPYVDGATGRRDLATACAAARVLARFHRAMHDLHVATSSGGHRGAMRSARFVGMLAWLRERFTRFAADPLVARALDWDALVAATTAATARVAPRAAALPHVVVHGDPNPGNVVSVQPGEVRGLIDFDFAHETERVYDVGTLLDEFARDGRRRTARSWRAWRRCSRAYAQRGAAGAGRARARARSDAAPRRDAGVVRRDAPRRARPGRRRRRAALCRTRGRDRRARVRDPRGRAWLSSANAALWALLALAVVSWS